MYPASSRLLRNQNLTRVETRVQAGPISVSLMLVALVALLALLYLNQVTKATSLNYRISTLETKRTELENRTQQLRIDAARLQSIEAAKKSQVAANLVPVTSASYAK